MGPIIVLVVIAVLWYRLTTPEQRKHSLAVAIDVVRQLKVAATKPVPEYDAFRAALKARMAYVIVTPAFAVISASVAVRMMFGPTDMGSPDTLLAWGANLGTLTTNGEWWRLVTSVFVHTSTLHVLVDVLVLIQLGGVLERLVGRVTLAAVFLSAGVFAGLVNLSSHPVNVTVAPSAAIFGLYGLLLASLFWQALSEWRRHRQPHVPRPAMIEPETIEYETIERETIESEDPAPEAADTRPAPVTLPLQALRRIGIVAALFFMYTVFGDVAHLPEFTGLLVGLAAGLVLTRRAADEEPGAREVAITMIATSAVALVCAIGLRNIADVKPEIARVVATEERTASAYEAGSDALKRGRMTAEALARLAENTIVPALQAEDARLEALKQVPPEHQPIVADAREYLRLRCESWRARAAAIRKTQLSAQRASNGGAEANFRLQAEARYRASMVAMATAEAAERASLEAFRRISPAPPPNEVAASK